MNLRRTLSIPRTSIFTKGTFYNANRYRGSANPNSISRRECQQHFSEPYQEKSFLSNIKKDSSLLGSKTMKSGKSKKTSKNQYGVKDTLKSIL